MIPALLAAALAVPTYTELRSRILDAADPAAVQELVDRVGPNKHAENAGAYWRALDETASLCEALLLRDVSPRFRHETLQTLFDEAAGGLISIIDLRPDDRRWIARWRRFDALLRRGLADADPDVRASFERYARRPSVTLDEARARVETAHETLVRLFPFERAFLERALHATRAVESDLAKLRERALKRPEARPALAHDIYVSVRERRALMAWARSYPEAVKARLGDHALRVTGLEIEPPSRKWPDYSLLLDGPSRAYP